MIRNLKALGLALVAVFAFGAMAAASASAYEGEITSTGAFTLVGHEITPGSNIFKAFGSEVTCTESTVTGHKTLTTAETEAGKTHELIPTGSSSFTLTLDLSSHCTANDSSGSHKATVTLTGCDFDVTITETIAGTSEYAVDFEEVCPAGVAGIEIEVYPFSGSELGGVVCTVKVKPQSGLTGGRTSESGAAILATNTVKGIHAERSGSGCASETTSNAEFALNTELVGKNSKNEATALDLSHP